MQSVRGFNVHEQVYEINYLLSGKASVAVTGYVGRCLVSMIWKNGETDSLYEGTLPGAITYLVGMKLGLDIGARV